MHGYSTPVSWFFDIGVGEGKRIGAQRETFSPPGADGFAFCKYGHEADFRKKVKLQNEAIFVRDANFVRNEWSIGCESHVSEIFTLVG